MVSRLRSDLWCAAFVRRHNDQGRMCVVVRKGDPIAGQIWIEIDHLDGTRSLFVPAPNLMGGDQSDWVFDRRFDHAPPENVQARVAREADFDPDFWVISLETRHDDPGISLVRKTD